MKKESINLVEFDQIKTIKLNDFVKNKGNYLNDNENIKGLETLQN